MADDADGDETGGCPKCGETNTDVVSMTTNDGLVSKVVDLPDEGFTVVSCEECGYSELYREGSSGSDVPRDLFLG
ncbi:nucleic acid-binding protein [Halobacteriales archaeon QH_6_64_20]|jgi:predicted nucleic-acid-binding Zn-ribbon protein|nr:MAG: nucleic acid-binding protein [Halobacteriales archaeon QH_6_64_20]